MTPEQMIAGTPKDHAAMYLQESNEFVYVTPEEYQALCDGTPEQRDQMVATFRSEGRVHPLTME